MSLLRIAAVFTWMLARFLIIVAYTGAFAVLGSLGLQSIGYSGELITIYTPAVLAVVLCVGGFHYLFGPELRREMEKEQARSSIRAA